MRDESRGERRQSGRVDPLRFVVGLVVVVIVGTALYMTRSQLEKTSCYVGENQRIVLYGGEGNRARILPPGEHPLAGYAYESDYVVPMGEVMSSFEVRIEQGKLATLGHALKRNRWVKHTPLADVAEALTPQPIFLTVKMVYDLDEVKLQKLVDSCNDQPFEEGIMPGLVNDAFVKERKDGIIHRLLTSDASPDFEGDPEFVAAMHERIQKALRKDYGITLKTFEILRSKQRDLSENESVRPVYKTARPAPESATIKMPPTFTEAVMENIGRIIGFIVFVVVILAWVVAGAPGSSLLEWLQ